MYWSKYEVVVSSTHSGLLQTEEGTLVEKDIASEIHGNTGVCFGDGRVQSLLAQSILRAHTELSQTGTEEKLARYKGARADATRGVVGAEMEGPEL